MRKYDKREKAVVTVHFVYSNLVKMLCETVISQIILKNNPENTLTAVFLRDIMSRRATGMHFFLCVQI